MAVLLSSKEEIFRFKKEIHRDFEELYANTLIGQSNRTRKSECYATDKGYDSEKIHALIREETIKQTQLYLKRRKKKAQGKSRK